MLVIDVMTKDVVTVKQDTPVMDALKIMLDKNIRRLPVVNEKGKLVGVVTQRRLESLKPRAGAPLIWQIGNMVAKTTVRDVMRKQTLTIRPMDTIESAVAKAQAAKVGTLIVMEEGQIIGIVSTNDVFYGVVNPTLGIGEPGVRIVIIGGGTGKKLEKIISTVNKMGIGIKITWAIQSPTNKQNNLVLHLDTDDASELIKELTRQGLEAKVVAR
jgi:acetoin utilization protein AcuB